MNLELSTTYFMNDSLESAVSKCISFGFTSLQLGCAHVSADINEVLALKKEFKLTYSMHAPVPSPRAELSPATKSFFFNSLNHARKLGVTAVILHPVNNDSLIREFCLKALALGITVCIENKGDDSQFNNLSAIKSLINRIALPNLKICYDTNHAFNTLKSEDAVHQELVSNFSLIGAVHLVRMQGGVIEHSPPISTPAMDSIIKTLKRTSFPVTLEVLPPVSRDEIIKSVNYINSL